MPRPTSPTRLARALAVLAPLTAASCGSRAAEPSDLLLLSTGTVNGYVEPCGCVAGQIGGIDRLASYLAQELSQHPAALFVDAGDLVAEDLELDPAVVEQLPAKMEAFVSTWASLGCAAIAVGEMDLLHLGAPALTELAERHGVPFLCGNLVDSDGRQVFPSHTIVERGGKRIGIFSLLAPRLKQAKVKDPKDVDVDGELARRGLRLQDWKERAAEIVAELAPRTDLILCASHLGFDANKRLARQNPAIDLVFGGHFGDAKQAKVFVKNTPVLVSLVRGSRVDRVEWWWDDPDAYFAAPEQRLEVGHGKLADVSDHVDVALAVELQEHEYEGMVARELAHPPEEYQKLLGDKVALLMEATRARDAMPPPPRGNRFSHVQVPMHRDIPRSDSALTAVDEYHGALGELWAPRPGDRPERQSAVFAGPERCEACHPLQTEFWRATRHSFALSSLRTTGQHVDAECFPCHTVGWGEPGGFLRPGRHETFEHVQCAACHGPTANHLSGGLSYFVPGVLQPVGPATCQRCHNDEHDPFFDEKIVERITRAACPQMEAPGERTPLMRQAALNAAEMLARTSPPSYQQAVAAYVAAALPEQALAAAQAWCDAHPRSLDAHQAAGQLLLDGGRSEEAAQHFAYVTERAPDRVFAWAGLARSLKDRDPGRAEMAAREAYSLAPSPPGARLLVEILVAAGRTAAATEIATGVVASDPATRPLFEELVEIPELLVPEAAPQ